MSLKRRIQTQAYTVARKLWLAQHRTCELWCSLYPRPRQSVEVHHCAGREGRLLLIEEHWRAACRECHTRLHTISPREAREHGWLYEASSQKKR